MTQTFEHKEKDMRKNSIVASVLIIFGALLRVKARSIAWPSRASWSGPREATQWAIREGAISEIAMVILVTGGALLVGTLLVAQLRAEVDRSSNKPSGGDVQ